MATDRFANEVPRYDDRIDAERLVPRPIPFEDRIEPRHMEAAAQALPNGTLGSISQTELAALMAQWTLVGRYEGEVATETKMKQAEQQGTGLGTGRFAGGAPEPVDPKQDERERQWAIEEGRAQSVRLAATISPEGCAVAHLLADATAIHAWITKAGESHPDLFDVLPDGTKRPITIGEYGERQWQAGYAQAKRDGNLPLKARPDFISGYDAGLADGRRLQSVDHAIDVATNKWE